MAPAEIATAVVRPLTDHRCRRVGRGAVPQLAGGVGAPTFGRAVRQQRTRMQTARRDRDRVGAGRSRRPVSTSWWWCRCPTDRRCWCPSIWRCRSPTTHTNGPAGRRSRSRWSGRSPRPASTSWSWCRCPTGRRRWRPSISRCRSPTTHTNGADPPAIATALGRRAGRSPRPASTSWSWCRCPTGRDVGAPALGGPVRQQRTRMDAARA